MSIYPPNSYKAKLPKNTQKVNPVSDFLTKGDIEWNPQAYTKWVDRTKIFSSEPHGIENAGVLIVKYENVDGKIKAVIGDVVTLFSWNIANRENSIQILVEDFERVRNAKKSVAGLIHSHPNGNLIPSLADWSLFSYLHALHPEDGMLFIIMDPHENVAIYNFPKDEPYSKSFTELFRREMEEAEKRSRKGKAERPDRGE